MEEGNGTMCINRSTKSKVISAFAPYFFVGGREGEMNNKLVI